MSAAPRRRAYNLMELVVVLTIIGAGAAVALPKWADTSARRRLEAAARRVELDVRLAQRIARATGNPGAVRFDAAISSYELVFPTWPQGVQAERDGRVRLFDDPLRVRILKLDAGNDEITIDAWGEITSGGAMVLGAGGYERTLTFP